MVNLVDTIIITSDPIAEVRGYNLLGREFVLPDARPERTETKTLDGVTLVDMHYKVPMLEYLRVVPEARVHRWDDDYVLIPVYVARPSFRPVYVKDTNVLSN